jgi:hypothetical protein
VRRCTLARGWFFRLIVAAPFAAAFLPLSFAFLSFVALAFAGFAAFAGAGLASTWASP